MATGVPKIAPEEVALSSDIGRYDAGVIVQRDAGQLAGAISDVLSNRERAAVLAAANGRRRVEERYSPEAGGEALCDVYQEIISKRGRGRLRRLSPWLCRAYGSERSRRFQLQQEKMAR